MRSSKRASLRYAQKEPYCHDTLGITHRGRDHRKPAPEKNHSREEVARPDVGHCQIGRDLTDNVTDGKDGVDDIELVAVKDKLLLHTRHIRIGQIGAIEIIKEVSDAAEGEDEEVDLP